MWRRAGSAATVVVVLLWPGAPLASAHDLSRSTSRLTVSGRTVRVVLTIGATDLHRGPVVDLDEDGSASIDEVDQVIPAVFAAVKQHYQLTGDGAAPVAIVLDRYGVSGGDTLRMDLRYTFAAPLRAVTVSSTLHALTQPDHRHLLHAVVGDASHEAVLDATRTVATIAGSQGAPVETARRFLALGVEHIATGYDHLAFVAGLLIGASSLFAVVKIVSAFTVAHSVTLALATLGWVTVPSRIIESAIALSIAWVAVENLLMAGGEGRWRVAFLFGLVHGFGFSNVLRDMELPPGALALSLFTFNFGVEVGQLLFIAATFPLLWLAMRAHRQSQVALVGSSLVFSLGVYWFVQRLLLG